MNIYGYDLPHLPMDFLVAVATSEPRLWIYGYDLVHGLFRLVHLVSVAGFLGSVLTLNMMQLGVIQGGSEPAARRPVLRVLEPCFWLAVASGAALFVYDPIGVGLHTMFLPKLVLVLAGYVQAKWRHPLPRRAIRRGFAATSLLLWLLVMGASTWNHIEHPRNPADLYRHEPGRERQPAG